MDAAQRAAYDHIADTWPELDTWRAQLTTTAPPPPGSDLAVDDTDFRPWCTSALARGGLMAAVDHLQAIRIHLKAESGFPHATGTLLRGALLGGSQAVWLLSPDDRSERLKRSRELAQEMASNHAKYMNDLVDITNPPAADNTAMQVVTAEVLHEIETLRETHHQASKFDATRTIETAAVATYDSKMKDEARFEWRGLSGSAHGYAWPLLNRSSNTITPTDDPGMVAIETGGMLSEYLNAFLLTHTIVAKGWDLLHQRSRV